MTLGRSIVVCSAALLVMGGDVDAQKGPAPADLLASVTAYLAAYAPRVSGVTLDEQYTLLDVSGGRIVTTRRLASDFVLLNLSGTVIGLRDAYALDENALREHTPRITTLLAKPSQVAWDQAQSVTRETHRQIPEELVARLNDPALALRFANGGNTDRMTWKIDGKKKIAGVETIGLRFEETKRKTLDYTVETRGKAAARGRFWVDPATGGVLRTELSMQSDSEFARIAVDYARDAALDLLLPTAMVDMYEVREVVGTNIGNLGAGSAGFASRSFDCRATYSKPTLTPIDLRVPK